MEISDRQTTEISRPSGKLYQLSDAGNLRKYAYVTAI